MDFYEKLSKFIFNIAASISLIVGGSWALYEFYEKKNAQRILETQKFIENVSIESTANSIKYIDEFWNKYKKPIDFLENRENYIIQIVNNDNAYRDSLNNILSFLNNIHHCISVDLCHKDLVIRYHRKLFLKTLGIHHAWLVQKRELTNHPEYYISLECFVRKNIKNFEPTREC